MFSSCQKWNKCPENDTQEKRKQKDNAQRKLSIFQSQQIKVGVAVGEEVFPMTTPAFFCPHHLLWSKPDWCWGEAVCAERCTDGRT